MQFTPSMIQILDKRFTTFLQADRIQQRISELALQINTYAEGKEVVFVVVLNGAFMFASDLLKQIEQPCKISFIKVKSYQGTETTGRVDEVIGLTEDLFNKDIIIVEDIVDTGITIGKVTKILMAQGCQSIQVATLLYKPSSFKGVERPTYIGFEIENKFVVGYGLDYEEIGRNSADIYQIV